MKFLNHTFLLRIAMAIILLMHSIPTMLDGGIFNFGNLYLNQVGFAPMGVPLAWLIKSSHVAAAISFITEKYVKINALITISILLVGIFMVHLPSGWYVVGGGRNGVEFNFILIVVLLTFLFPNGFYEKNK